MNNKKRFYEANKRIGDICLALLFCGLLSPTLIFLLIITAIDLKGKPLFFQKRLGRNERPFTIIKFRTMKTDAPNIGAEYLSEERSDQYTTKWGRFLRKTSLDELPQLFNILGGSMSFIGPRPGLTKDGEAELVAERESYIPSAYSAKPGLSGYAQILLKRSHDIKERARLDSYYVAHESFVLDTKLFFFSFLVIFGFFKGK